MLCVFGQSTAPVEDIANLRMLLAAGVSAPTLALPHSLFGCLNLTHPLTTAVACAAKKRNKERCLKQAYPLIILCVQSFNRFLATSKRKKKELFFVIL